MPFHSMSNNFAIILKENVNLSFLVLLLIYEGVGVNGFRRFAASKYLLEFSSKDTRRIFF